MSTGDVKTIKGDNPDNEFAERKITLKGVEYTIRDLDVPQYEECLKAAEKPDGSVPFGDLLKVMVMRAVSPSPAARKRPLPYPVYRTLENIVNVMHFLDLPDEAAPPDKDADGEPEAVPNV